MKLVCNYYTLLRFDIQTMVHHEKNALNPLNQYLLIVTVIILGLVLELNKGEIYKKIK